MKHRHRHPNAYRADILRTIRKESRRFLAVMSIAALGVMMFSGLRASCEDLRRSADRFFDQQNLHDLSIASTMGLTDDDVQALRAVDGVGKAEGFCSVKANVSASGRTHSVTMITLSDSGMDQPLVLEGRLPETLSETAVTQKFLHDTGLTVGDTITIQDEGSEGASQSSGGSTTGEASGPEKSAGGSTTEAASAVGESAGSSKAETTETSSRINLPDVDEDISAEDEGSASLRSEVLTIVGAVTDPTDINNPFGSLNYRSGSANTAFVVKDAIDSGYYTSVRLTIEGTEKLYCFSSAYKDTVRAVKSLIEEDIREKRESSRTAEIKGKAESRAADASLEAAEKLESASDALESGQQQLESAQLSGKDQIESGENHAESEFSAARQKLDSAQDALNAKHGSASALLESQMDQMESGLAEIQKQSQQLRRARESVATGQSQLEAGAASLAAAEESVHTQLAAGLSTVRSKQEELRTQLREAESGRSQLASTWQQAEDGLKELQDARAGLESAAVETPEATGASTDASTDASARQDLAGIDEKISEAKKTADELKRHLDKADEGISTLKAALGELEKQENALLATSAADAQFPRSRQLLKENQDKLDSGAARIESGEQAAESAKNRLESGLDAAADASRSLEDAVQSAQEDIDSGRAEYESGSESAADAFSSARARLSAAASSAREELAKGRSEYEDALSEIKDKLSDARRQIQEIDDAQWYVQDRMSLSGYSNIDSDASAIESIATVFPVVFFLVAILISLTAVTRMVAEDRGLIGTYRSLGYTGPEILRKYLLFAGAACLSGCLIGTVLAFSILPLFIFRFFRVMYLLPHYRLWLYPVSALLGPALFLAGVLLAAGAACAGQLREVPAQLMRPEAPPAGSRVLLERIRPLWRHLSFLSKVTARNLFRYKKRLFMTVIGITGCMALLLFGFAVNDSVNALPQRQFSDFLHYDVIAVSPDDDNSRLMEHLQEDRRVRSTLPVTIQSADIVTDTGEISVTVIAIPDGADLSAYLTLKDTSGQNVRLQHGCIAVTRNAGIVGKFGAGDDITLRLADLQTADIPVTSIVQNDLGNYVYLPQSTFETLFDTAENGALILLDRQAGESAFTDELESEDFIASVTSTEDQKNSFTSTSRLIGGVVGVVIAMSAALAFAVLFTLSSTNISERERELATIKVLGFYPREVHRYINREMMLLSGIGILLGLPAGRIFAGTLTSILDLPSIYLETVLLPSSYLYSVLLTLAFALVVALVMGHVLDAIDPAQALKSAE